MEGANSLFNYLVGTFNHWHMFVVGRDVQVHFHNMGIFYDRFKLTIHFQGFNDKTTLCICALILRRHDTRISVLAFRNFMCLEMVRKNWCPLTYMISADKVTFLYVSRMAGGRFAIVPITGPPLVHTFLPFRFTRHGLYHLNLGASERAVWEELIVKNIKELVGSSRTSFGACVLLLHESHPSQNSSLYSSSQ